MRRLLGVGELSTNGEGSITLSLKHDHTDDFPTDAGPVAVLKSDEGVEIVPMSSIVATTRNAQENTRVIGQRQRTKGIKEVIRDLQGTFDDFPGVPEPVLFERTFEEGYSEQETEEYLEELIDKGEVYHPPTKNNTDYYRLV